jgi:RNA polymerase sigma-70 factor (ECF subfamily)
MSILDDTTRLVERVQAGDKPARSALLAHVCNRLQSLAHEMLRSYPVIRRWEETGDVLQVALMRLSKALDDVQLQSVRHFYRLAALQIRRELIDLARRYQGPEGLAANHDTDSHDPEHGVLACKPSRDGEPSTTAEWNELHEAVERLPEDEREVIDLTMYQNLGQKEAAALLGVDERTIRRRLQSARLHLDKMLNR